MISDILQRGGHPQFKCLVSLILLTRKNRGSFVFQRKGNVEISAIQQLICNCILHNQSMCETRQVLQLLCSAKKTNRVSVSKYSWKRLLDEVL